MWKERIPAHPFQQPRCLLTCFTTLCRHVPPSGFDAASASVFWKALLKKGVFE
jgi:hypothetical protein